MKIFGPGLLGGYGLSDYTMQILVDQTGSLSCKFSIGNCSSIPGIYLSHVVPIVHIFVDAAAPSVRNGSYTEEDIDVLPVIWTLFDQCLPDLDYIVANVDRAGAIISGEKSDWFWDK